MNDHVPPKPFRCSYSSISHRWPSGLGVSCTKVFSAASPAVPAPIMATRLTCSVATGSSDVEVSPLRSRCDIRWMYCGHDSQLNKAGGTHDKHRTERARAVLRITISCREEVAVFKGSFAARMMGVFQVTHSSPLQARFNSEPWPAVSRALAGWNE